MGGYINTHFITGGRDGSKKQTTLSSQLEFVITLVWGLLGLSMAACVHDARDPGAAEGCEEACDIDADTTREATLKGGLALWVVMGIGVIYFSCYNHLERRQQRQQMMDSVASLRKKTDWIKRNLKIIVAHVEVMRADSAEIQSSAETTLPWGSGSHLDAVDWAQSFNRERAGWWRDSGLDRRATSCQAQAGPRRDTTPEGRVAGGGGLLLPYLVDGLQLDLIEETVANLQAEQDAVVRLLIAIDNVAKDMRSMFTARHLLKAAMERSPGPDTEHVLREVIMTAEGAIQRYDERESGRAARSRRRDRENNVPAEVMRLH